jgi:hemoglobin
LRHEAITEAGLSDQVERFYARARLDPVLGPVFDRAITDWPPHIAAIKAFWARVMLGVTGYAGNAFARHQDKGIEPDMFDRWLTLWGETAQEVFEPDPAAELTGRAELIGRGLKSGLFFGPPTLG